jgi:predicted metalloprotease with PDZ domain
MKGSLRCATVPAFITILIILALGTPAGAQAPLGPIRLEVDASHAPQKILHGHEQIPVRPGPLVLYYAKWIPGEHMPDGPIGNLAGLRFTANGKTIPWRRDLVNMFAFHLDIPAGVESLDADFDFLLSAPTTGYSAGASATAYLNVLSWNQVLLYPQGYAADQLTFVPSLRIPDGWKFGTALPGPKQKGDTIDFAPVPLNTLVDSPVLTGLYFRAIQLTPGESPSHEIDIVSDSKAALAMSPETQVHLHDLMEQAGALFGSRHYRDYHFLLSLSDNVAHFGLEHHESSDDRTYQRSLIDSDALIYFSDLLPHEFVHSWNGKYRRPADLVSTDYQQPMRDDLLWVYEGLTNYLGEVLTARSGLWSAEQGREELARLASVYSKRPGRDWRPLQDTADSAVFLYGADAEWANWRRSTDFYEEGELLWLDVDTTLRRLTNDKKSLNDFCRAFHGGPGGKPELKTYTFDDIVTALNSVAPYDWSGFLRTRLDSTAPATPIEAIENSGWKLAYNDNPNEIESVREAVRKEIDLTQSIGLALGENGRIYDVMYDGPSYKAGIGPGMKITAVNGNVYSPAVLKEAIEAAQATTAPIRLILANGTEVQTYSVDYHGGIRYPHLVRDESRPNYLEEILHPLAPR